MSAIEDKERALSGDKTCNWRAEELVRAGYEPTDAIALAARHDIDLHEATGLIQRGCPYELAIEILI